MLNKESVYAVLKAELRTRKMRIEKSLSDSVMAMSSETKSSAGDKHETGRAMAQLEQEKLSGQLATATQLSGIITGIDPSEKHDQIQFGSLIQLDDNWYFFSVGIGVIMVETIKVFCLSASTPIGKILLTKKSGDQISFNGKNMTINTLL
ncbi:MAG: transcription elongation GreA/GreB family factor [Flavobacteriaceae bacterium]|jgi:transcription elongation GreA/GreB family factor